jgi:hypothetical protein
VIAAPWVVEGPSEGRYRSELGAKASGRKLTPSDLATATLDALDRTEWIGHIVGVAD